MSDVSVHTIEARTHGRFLARVPNVAPPWPLLVGFHGYAETAGDHMEALQTIPGKRRVVARIGPGTASVLYA
jgi:hypothetical protein